MSANPIVPLLSDLAPDGFVYTGQYMVEFDADSLWYETSLTIAALALRRGFKTEYHVFDHFPSEALRALSDLGVDAKRFEAEGQLSIWDSYTETTEFDKAKTTGIGWDTAGERPLNIAQGAESWVERTKKGYAPGEMRWLHLDDNTGIFLQYNDEETVVDRWRTAILPAVRARECPHFLAFPKGIASEAFYTKFEALCDGIIDLKTEEVEGRVERFLRIRRLKGKVFDSRWHRLEVQADGAVRFATLPSPGPARRLAAIMFTDLVGFTALGQQNEALSLELLEDQRALLRPIFQRHGGREVKTIGDGFLVEFPNALESVRCAYEIQQSSREVNLSRPSERRVVLRVGVHLGDVVDTHGDISGDAVNVASRIEPLAEPGGVCITRPVYDQVQNKVPYPLENMGSRMLKGVQTPMEVYRVVLASEVVTGTPHAVPSGPPRLAVLPLTNISPDPNDAYFADGMTEELITVLSQIGSLRVIARTSVIQYKDTNKPIAQIGSELGVSSVLEGSVRKAGDQLRITVQLIDVPTQEHRWAQTYDRKLENVFAIQAEVAEQTAQALRVELLPADNHALRVRPTSSLTAYEFYLRGIQAAQHMEWGGSPNLQEAHERIESYFMAAIREDPEFSAAYARLATHLVLTSGDTRPAKEGFPQARELANRALALSPKSSEAHEALGQLSMQADHDWGRAEREFQQAIALNPSSSTAHEGYATLLSVLQRYREAEKQELAALELNPLWIEPRVGLCTVYWQSRPIEEAMAAIETLMEPFRDERSVNFHLALYYAVAGKPEAARKRLEPYEGETTLDIRSQRGLIFSVLGNPSELRALVTDLEQGRVSQYFGSSYPPQMYAELGEKERALQLLEQDHRDGEDMLWNTYRVSSYDEIREDPRFSAILRSLNLPLTIVRPWRRVPSRRPH